MPTASIAYSATNFYNGGWGSYATSRNSYFGYATSSGYLAAVMRFTSPTFTGIPSTLEFSIPMLQGWSGVTSVTCYASITSTDPSTLGTVYAASSPGTDSGRICSETKTFSVSGTKATMTFSLSCSSLASNTTYYLVLSAASSTNAAAFAYGGSSVTGTLTYAYPASVPTLSATTTAMGSSVTIYTNREDSSYTHTLTYSFGSASGTIGTSVGASTTWTPPLTLANQIPNATSGYGTITCKTYSGSTLYGTKSVTFYLTVPSSVVPTISAFTATRVDNRVPSSWGIYVQGVSQATLATTASGAYSSTIKSYSITGGLSGASVTTGVLTTAGTNTWTVTVTDSRGRTATKSVSVDVVAYTAPTISGAAFERCDADGTPNDDGVCLQCKAKISISSCEELNSYTAEVFYKLQSASSWTSAGDYDTSGEAQIYALSLSDDAYDVRLEVTDSIQTVYTGSTLDIGTVLMEYDPDENQLHFSPPLILDGGFGYQNAGAHNCFYRGKYLGDTLTSAQAAAIAAGTFDDLYIGDYWTIDGVNWRIAAFDYYYFCGDTNCNTHHIVVVPDTSLYTAAMNSSNTTSGGYVGAAMYTSGLDAAKTTIKAAFGSDHILSHRVYLVDAVTDGEPSSSSWYDSEVELLSRHMLFGGALFEHTGFTNYTVEKSQLPLFALNHRLIGIRTSYWMRDVAGKGQFATINYSGLAQVNNASGSYGVRPYFCVC